MDVERGGERVKEGVAVGMLGVCRCSKMEVFMRKRRGRGQVITYGSGCVRVCTTLCSCSFTPVPLIVREEEEVRGRGGWVQVQQGNTGEKYGD